MSIGLLALKSFIPVCSFSGFLHLSILSSLGRSLGFTFGLVREGGMVLLCLVTLEPGVWIAVRLSLVGLWSSRWFHRILIAVFAGFENLPLVLKRLPSWVFMTFLLLSFISKVFPGDLSLNLTKLWPSPSLWVLPVQFLGKFGRFFLS